VRDLDIRIGTPVTVKLLDFPETRHVVTGVRSDGSFTMERVPEVVVGWVLPPGAYWCPRCDTRFFDKVTRVCITCTPDHPRHDPQEIRARAALRAAAERLREDARRRPAPCGCALSRPCIAHLRDHPYITGEGT
jgi:hypothetical protein